MAAKLVSHGKKNKVTLARIDGRDLNQSICKGKAEQDVLWLSRKVCLMSPCGSQAGRLPYCDGSGLSKPSVKESV